MVQQEVTHESAILLGLQNCETCLEVFSTFITVKYTCTYSVVQCFHLRNCAVHTCTHGVVQSVIIWDCTVHMYTWCCAVCSAMIADPCCWPWPRKPRTWLWLWLCWEDVTCTLSAAVCTLCYVFTVCIMGTMCIMCRVYIKCIVYSVCSLYCVQWALCVHGTLKYEVLTCGEVWSVEL
mgnify:CR=1 FL=1